MTRRTSLEATEKLSSFRTARSRTDKHPIERLRLDRAACCDGSEASQVRRKRNMSTHGLSVARYFPRQFSMTVIGRDAPAAGTLTRNFDPSGDGSYV